MTRPLPIPADRLTVSTLAEPPNDVKPREVTSSAGAEYLPWVVRRQPYPR